MKILYQNYNKLFLFEKNGEKLVKKVFSNKFCWENETKVVGIMKYNGFLVPEIVATNYLENTYKFIEDSNFESILKKYPEKIDLLLDFVDNFKVLPKKDFLIFDKSKENIEMATNMLFNQEDIKKSLYFKILDFSSKYTQKFSRVIHGDFRPSNVFGRKKAVKEIIDFEFTGVGDPNKDLAYLWVGTININKKLKKYLKTKFEEKNYFDEKAFSYWNMYMNLMVLCNPRTKERKSWIINLKEILDEI